MRLCVPDYCSCRRASQPYNVGFVPAVPFPKTAPRNDSIVIKHLPFFLFYFLTCISFSSPNGSFLKVLTRMIGYSPPLPLPFLFSPLISLLTRTFDQSYGMGGGGTKDVNSSSE